MPDNEYQLGSVWVITMIKVKHGMCDEYLKELVPIRHRLMDEAMKRGLVRSHKILHGFSYGNDDWDILIMVEYPDWAALDGLNKKLQDINVCCLGSEENALHLMEKRSVSRTFLGDKVMQEIIAG